jgi:hypothetical protein
MMTKERGNDNINKLRSPVGIRTWVPLVDLTAWIICGWAVITYESRGGCPGAIIKRRR